MHCTMWGLRVLIRVTLLCVVSAGSVAARVQPRPQRTGPAQFGVAPAASNHVIMQMCYAFSVSQRVPTVRIVVALPRSIEEKQKILEIAYSIEPVRIFYEDENRYAEFILIQPEELTTLRIDIEAELYRYDLGTARERKKTSRVKDAAIADFLKEEQYLEKDEAAIQDISESLKGETDVDKVRAIYSYVIENMEYEIVEKDNLGAVYAAKNNKGDCTEYSDLFVALCRAKGIPARVITGYTARFDEVSPKHHWVEVYLKDYGWVPFDPSWGDTEDKFIRNMAFERLQPAYVYLSHIRNDPVLYDHHFYAYSYYGSNGSFTNSVKFRQPSEKENRP